jgi:hypothetical protein
VPLPGVRGFCALLCLFVAMFFRREGKGERLEAIPRWGIACEHAPTARGEGLEGKGEREKGIPRSRGRLKPFDCEQRGSHKGDCRRADMHTASAPTKSYSPLQLTQPCIQPRESSPPDGDGFPAPPAGFGETMLSKT